MKEKLLFDKPVGRGESTSKIDFDHKTSGVAFKNSSVKANTVQHSVLMALHKTGLICEEVEEVLGKSHQSVSACLTALKKKGLVYKWGTQKTSTGTPANVWFLTVSGVREVKRWKEMNF